MSYRIHLNVIDKNKFNKYLQKNKNGYDKNLCNLWYLPDIAKEHIEIWDEVGTKQFKKIKLNKDMECHPRILNKKDFQSILDFYKKKLLEIANDDVDRIEKFKEQYDETNKDKAVDELFYFYNRHFNSAYWIKWYFEGIEEKYKNKINVINSDYFLLQYFYLVRLYENFDYKKNVLIITHG